jgi:ribosomal protein L37E
MCARNGRATMSRRTRPCLNCGIPIRQPWVRVRRRKWKYCRKHRQTLLRTIMELIGDSF